MSARPLALALFFVAVSTAHARPDGGMLPVVPFGHPRTIVDAGTQPPPAEDSSAGGLVIEDWSEPIVEGDGGSPSSASSPSDAGLGEVPSLAASSFEVSARAYGRVRTLAGVDTQFESLRGEPLAENVFDFRTRAVLGADLKLSDSMRAVIEGRAFWRITGQRGFDRTQGDFELDPGEIFVDLYGKKVDFRFGNQVVSFGANAAFAPSDQLNPRDLRTGFILADPWELKIPNLGARAVGTIGKVTWTAAYFPFFQPDRYSVIGSDEAFVQPALGVNLSRQVDESIEAELQPHLLETKRPRAFPWLGDLGLRATTQAGSVQLGLSWIWIWEKLPMVTLDPELASLLRAQARGNPPDPATALSVQNRFLAGEQLLSGTYPRQHIFSGEAQALIGTAQLDVDLAYSPAQTLFASDLTPLRKATVTWVVGLSQAEDSPLLYNLTYLGIAVPDLPSRGFLFLLEPATAAGAPHTVWFHALFGTVGYQFLERRLEVSVRGGFEPIQGSYVLAPRVSWKGWERLMIGVGAEVYQGRVFSPFGYFGRNDQVVAQLQYDFL